MGNAHERFDRQGTKSRGGVLPLAVSKGCTLSLAQARHLLSAFADTPAAISDVLFWELLASDDVRFWHKADMPITLRNVRFRG